MRIIIFILFFTLSYPMIAYAQEKVSDNTTESQRKVPQITYRQRVQSVVEIQKLPQVLSATVEQESDTVLVNLTLSNDIGRKEAKDLATQFVRIIKKNSLDENPVDRKVGTGLYTYMITVVSADQATLATGIKPFEEPTIQWAINDDIPTD